LLAATLTAYPQIPRKNHIAPQDMAGMAHFSTITYLMSIFYIFRRIVIKL
jgi:hypothetical protein